MVFSMKGGGLKFHIPILNNEFFENHLESFPDCENVFKIHIHQQLRPLTANYLAMFIVTLTTIYT